MKSAEYKERGLAMFRYLKRNNLDWRLDELREIEIVELGKSGVGDYEQPLITPYELREIGRALRKSFPRARSRYPLGKYTVVFYNDKVVVPRKDHPFDHMAIPELGIDLVLRHFQHNAGRLCYHDRWVWKKRPSDENLMLLRMALPQEFLKHLG